MWWAKLVRREEKMQNIYNNKRREQICNLCAQSIKLRAWIIQLYTQFFFLPDTRNNQQGSISKQR